MAALIAADSRLNTQPAPSHPPLFEQERERLAQHVWEGMLANDSRECRSCHSPSRWDLNAAPIRIRVQHQKVVDGEKTCIECHAGIAHRLPQKQ